MSYRSQIIHINSANRNEGGTPSNFTIDISNALFRNQKGDDQKIRVEPIQAVINRSWYTVDETNNSFILNIDDEPILKTIPTGFWNVKTFLAVLNGLLPGWTIGWQENLNKYKYQPPNDGKVYSFYFPTYACFLLGFNYKKTVQLDSILGTYSIIPIKMNSEDVLLIRTSFQKQEFSAVDNLLTNEMAESDILVKIPISVAPFDNLIWRSNSRNIVSFNLKKSYLTSLNIFLTDEYNRQLLVCYDWTMSIRVEYVEEHQAVDLIESSVNSIKDYLRLLILENQLGNSAMIKQRKAIKKSKQKV